MNLVLRARDLTRAWPIFASPVVIDWRRALLQGSIVGILPLAVDIPLLATISMLGASDASRFFVIVVVISMGRGVAWACTAQWVEGRLSVPAMVFVFLAETVILTGVSVWLFRLLEGPWNAGFVMLLWLNLAYGSAFFAYCVMSQRSLRVNSVLARARLARERTLAALDEARVHEISVRVDPAFMLRVLSAIEQFYECDRQRADVLLNSLAAFLRLAMPAVRSGRSTISAEVSLLYAYQSLQLQLDPEREPCRVDIDRAIGGIAFPPMILVPLIDAAWAAGVGAPCLSLRKSASGLAVALDSLVARPLADNPFLERLQHQLRSVPGSTVCIRDVGTSPSLILSFPFPRTTP